MNGAIQVNFKTYNPDAHSDASYPPESGLTSGSSFVLCVNDPGDPGFHGGRRNPAAGHSALISLRGLRRRLHIGRTL